MDEVIHTIEKDKSIPFVDILQSYSQVFSKNMGFELTNSKKNKLRSKLLDELSFVQEVTLQYELDNFIQGGNDDFHLFIRKASSSLPINYPFLDNVLQTKTANYTKHISNIINRFEKDCQSIIATFHINTQEEYLKIVDIDVSLGDGHNGEGSAMVHLSNGTKLIYKPRNVGISNSYNSFIDWVNSKLKTDLKTFSVLDCTTYGWLEFVNHDGVDSEDELSEYYYKAGVLLAVTLLLGSKDCHRENVIASGKNPVMIDHETIIQPFLNNSSIRSWDEQHKIPRFSVLESVLIINPATGVPLDCTGYGVNGNTEVTELEKITINPNTIKSKRTTRFITRKIIDKNIPVYNGKYIFANEYKEDFVNGFSAAYDVFINSKEELKSIDSPLEFFKKNEVRYIWRPTFVYFKILKYMRSASFMSSYEAYKSRLYELLSKAYEKEDMNEYRFILDFEMEQMLNGDIPVFSLSTLTNFLKEKESLKIFEKNCIENIYQRIDSLSFKHKNEQINYINRWLNM